MTYHPRCESNFRWNRRDLGRSALHAAAVAALGGLTHRSLAQQIPGDDTHTASPLRVLVWCEGTAPKSVYPQDVDGTIASDLNRRPGLVASTGRLDAPDAGLSDAELDAADVLVWWGRLRHDDVPEDRAEAVAQRVRDGSLGLVALHASFASKPFRMLMESSCMPGAWREDGQPEHVRIEAPNHPIARGIDRFTIPLASMFAEPFAVPEPDAVVCVSTWDSGETFRSGLTWNVGRGRVAYFRPGHEGFPVLFHPAVRQIIANSVTWAAGRA